MSDGTTLPLAGTVGLVTGAGSGIGRASAMRMAADGAHVAVLDVDVNSGHETVEQIRTRGGDATFHVCDVTDADAVAKVIGDLVDTHARLDFAHNNAGVAATQHRLDELPESDWDRVIGVNLKGVWLCMKHELQVMRRQRRGAIVNTASVCGTNVAPMTSPYNTAKHGVIGLTKEAAVEVAAEGIRVNSVSPGYVTTAMSLGATTPEVWAAMGTAVPMGRVAEPAEIANAVAWLLSDAASYVTGHSLVIDGALTIGMPGPKG